MNEYTMTDMEIRLECLRLAHSALGDRTETTEEIIKAAYAYYGFIWKLPPQD